MVDAFSDVEIIVAGIFLSICLAGAIISAIEIRHMHKKMVSAKIWLEFLEKYLEENKAKKNG